jgi:Glycosyltransferase family 87
VIGSVTPLLLLAAAATWRWRDNPRVVAVALGGVIALKLILWPLLIWLWATGRRLQAIAAFSVALATCAIGWAIVGFPSLAGYAHLLSSLSALEGNRGYSLVRVGHLLGASSQVADIAAYAAGAVVLLLVAISARRGVDERRTFTLAIVASLALTPIVWQQYFAILLVPIALSRPRLDIVWFLPLAFWLAPYNLSEDRTAPVILTAAVVLILIGALLRRPRTAAGVAARPVAAVGAD